MKIKQHLCITNPEKFLRGDYSDCFGLFDHEVHVTDWIQLHEIELDLSQVDTEKAIEVVKEALNEREKELMAQLEVIKNRRADLLALGHDG